MDRQWNSETNYLLDCDICYLVNVRLSPLFFVDYISLDTNDALVCNYNILVTSIFHYPFLQEDLMLDGSEFRLRVDTRLGKKDM